MKSDSIGRDAQSPSGRTPADAQSIRLGLALSGGGFRATLFHLGVLLRLAELDLLRHLNVISSVSGGSVLAAHYMLDLKGALESSAKGTLSRDEYVALVERLRSDLRGAMERLPRSVLFRNPWVNFRMLFLGWTPWRLSLSGRMAGLYQRLLYRRATEALPVKQPEDIARGVTLCRMHISPGAAGRIVDLERFNARDDFDRVPKVVLNAATLNTARKFTFTFSEVGDELLGFVRCDERRLLIRYKLLLRYYRPSVGLPAALALADKALARIQPAATAAGDQKDASRPNGGTASGPRRYTAEHLAWWHAAHAARARVGRLPGLAADALAKALAREFGPAETGPKPPTSSAVRYLMTQWDDSLRFLGAQPGTLRQVKIAAWYLLDDRGWETAAEEEREVGGEERPGSARRGGFTREEHARSFWRAVRDIDTVMATRLQTALEGSDGSRIVLEDLLEFTIEIYYFRMAENLHERALGDITLPLAAQASANFPPVFAPLAIRDLFDSALVNPLKLSDGGLNDNNGIETLLEERCSHIVASEASPQPHPKRDVGFNRPGMMAQIVLNQLPIVRRIQLRWLRDHARVHAGMVELPSCRDWTGPTPGLEDLRRRFPVASVAFFQIDSNPNDGIVDPAQPPPLAQHPWSKQIARLRTDLDGFGEIEQDALLYQGYQYADRFLRRYVYPDFAARGLVPAAPPKPRPPVRLPQDDPEWERYRRVLEAGRSLCFRAAKIPGPWKWGYLLGTLALAGLSGIALVLVATRLYPAAKDLAWERLPGFVQAPWRLPLEWIVGGMLGLWALLSLFGLWMWFDGWCAFRASRRG